MGPLSSPLVTSYRVPIVTIGLYHHFRSMHKSALSAKKRMTFKQLSL